MNRTISRAMEGVATLIISWEAFDMKCILATGISGCGRKEYLSDWEEYCRRKGKNVKVFHVGQMMFKHATDIGLKLKPENILNADRGLLNVLRSAVLISILEEIKGANYDAVVICIHGFFYWESVFIRAFDKFLNRFSPSLFVSFIEDFRRVVHRLDKRPQWQDEKLNDEKILLWQNVEVEVTASLAQFADKPFFAVPTGSPVTTLYKLVFHPEIEPVYIAMPISHFREPEQRIPIDKFILELDRYFTVFNPLSVEIVGAVSVDHKKEKMIDEIGAVVSNSTVNHIVHRDEQWFVGQAEKIIVLWPKVDMPPSVKESPELVRLWPKTVASPGVDHETHEAFGKTKDVWVVFLSEEASPFVARYATKMFLSESDFFSFLDKKYPDRKNLEW